MPAAKRKSDADAGASSSKKARTSHADAKALVKAILAKPNTYPILDDDDALRRSLVQLARYAKDLDEELQGGESSSSPKTLTPEQLQAAVEKIRKAANSGIKKQMSVCSSGSFLALSCHVRMLSDVVGGSILMSVESLMQDWLFQMGLRWCLCRSSRVRDTPRFRWSPQVQDA
jgi:hypothetical protein